MRFLEFPELVSDRIHGNLSWHPLEAAFGLSTFPGLVPEKMLHPDLFSEVRLQLPGAEGGGGAASFPPTERCTRALGLHHTHFIRLSYRVSIPLVRVRSEDYDFTW